MKEAASHTKKAAFYWRGIQKAFLALPFLLVSVGVFAADSATANSVLDIGEILDLKRIATDREAMTNRIALGLYQFGRIGTPSSFALNDQGDQNIEAFAVSFTDLIVGTQSPSPILAGATANFPLTIDFSGGGTTGCSVALSIVTSAGQTGLPSGIARRFTPSTVIGTGGSVSALLEIATTAGVTPPGIYTFSVRGNAANVAGEQGCIGAIRTVPATLIVSTGLVATSTTVSSSANPSSYGDGLVFTATVSAASGSTSPSGTVQFKINGTNFGSPVAVVPNGTSATASSAGINNLLASASPHSVEAVFSGTGKFMSSSSVQLGQVVRRAPTVTSVECGTDLLTFNGKPQMPCTATVSGSLKFEGQLAVNYENNVNAGTASASSMFAGDGNYEPSADSTEFTIGRAQVQMTAGGGSTIYDGLEKTPSECVVSGLFIGNLTCSNDQKIVGPDAGDYVIHPTVHGDGLSNFEINSIAGTYSITKAPTATSVIFEDGAYYYRGLTYTATARVTGPGGLDLALITSYGGDCLNVTVENGCSAHAEFAETANHLASSKTEHISIAKLPVAVYASSHAVRFGDPVPAVAAGFYGLLPNESAEDIDELPNCETDYAPGSPVGTYPTRCENGEDNNYELILPYTDGTVEVSSACEEFNGFLEPIGGSNRGSSMSGAGGSYENPLREFRSNSSIPFKFTASCSGQPLENGVHTLSAQKFEDDIPSEIGSTIQGQNFVSDGEQWRSNFRTRDLGTDARGTWKFTARLYDGSEYSVWLRIR